MQLCHKKSGMIIEDHAADLTVVSHRRRQQHPNLDAEKTTWQDGKVACAHVAVGIGDEHGKAGRLQVKWKTRVC